MTQSNAAPSFSLGQIVATPGALEGLTPAERRLCLVRHAACDWGDVGPEDARANDDALRTGARLFSVYKFADRKLWIITEAVGDDDERASTCLLTPEEY